MNTKSAVHTKGASASDGSLRLLESQILPRLAPGLRHLIAEAGQLTLGQGTDLQWEEIRLRAGAPLLVVASAGDFFIDPQGRPVTDMARAYHVSVGDIQHTFDLICDNSLYAHESELRQGYVTLPGGHRIGFCGRVVMRGDGVFALKEVTSLNIRLARDVKGAAERLLPWLLDRKGVPHNTLIFSPPGGGKTTILRDLVRQLSCGRPDLGFPGLQIAVADERSEVAAARRGGIEHEVGPRVDVMDGCPKSLAMMVLIRGMAPQVLVTDEIGRPEDAAALGEALRCGVRVIATAHGGSLADLAARPMLRDLIRANVFSRLVRLGRSQGPGTIEEVWDGRDATLLFPSGKRGNLIQFKG